MERVNGFSVDDLRKAGWNDEQIKNHPEYSVLMQPAPAPAAGGPTVGDAFNRDNVGRGMHAADDMQSDASAVSFGGGPDYEACVITAQQKIVRLIGDYARARVHWVMCDDGNNRPFNCGYIDESGRCIFEDMTDPLIGPNSYELVVDPNVQVQSGQRQKKKRQYRYKEHNPSLFAELLGEGAANANSWFGKEFFLFNVIDRDSKWCEQNRHTKLLCKSDKGLGIGSTMFMEISNQAAVHGKYFTFDYVISKSGTGVKTKYSATIAPGDAKIPLTEEERQYRIYDLGKYIEPAKLDYVMQNLAGKFKLIIDFCRQMNILTPAQEKYEKIMVDQGLIRQGSTSAVYTPPVKGQIASAPTSVAPAAPQTAPATPATPATAPAPPTAPQTAPTAPAPAPAVPSEQPAPAAPPAPSQVAPTPPAAPPTPPSAPAPAPAAPQAAPAAPVPTPEAPAAPVPTPEAPPAPAVPAPAPAALPPAPATPPAAPAAPQAALTSPPAAPVATETPAPPPAAPAASQAAPAPAPAALAPAPANEGIDVSQPPGIQCPSCGKMNSMDATSCADCGSEFTPF